MFHHVNIIGPLKINKILDIFAGRPPFGFLLKEDFTYQTVPEEECNATEFDEKTCKVLAD